MTTRIPHLRLSALLVPALLAAGVALTPGPPAHAAAGAGGQGTCSQAPPPGASVVALHFFAIHPEHLTVRAGSRVTWCFEDNISGGHHSVTSQAHSGGLRFRSSRVLYSGIYTVTFVRRGRYYYRCSIHDFMRGQVTVR